MQKPAGRRRTEIAVSRLAIGNVSRGKGGRNKRNRRRQEIGAPVIHESGSRQQSCKVSNNNRFYFENPILVLYKTGTFDSYNFSSVSFHNIVYGARRSCLRLRLSRKKYVSILRPVRSVYAVSIFI